MAIERQLAKLTIVVLPTIEGRERPSVPGFDNGRLEVLFNPTEYSIDRETSYAEIAVPGLDSPVLQYVRGNGDKMTFELFLDITDRMQDGRVVTGQSVRELFIDPLERLLLQNERLHAPPPVMLLWGKEVVMDSAVARSLSVKYTLFDTGGRPVRATANLTLQEHKSASAQLAEQRLQSPDLTNTAILRAGDTLPAIAFREYGDAAQWRPIALANGLSNPLDLTPGVPLVVPKIV
jgi:nucleoid-associated protein YgaU